MRKQVILLMLLFGAALLTTGVFIGCETLPVEGTMKVNAAPTIEWAVVPQDSMRHSSNPLLKWIGKDTNGQIISLDYEYCVVLEEDVNANGGAAAMAADFDTAYVWTSVGNATKAVIPLYASEDTSVFVDQFVFMRCSDENGDYSNIIYVFLSRNNHPPTCSINVPPGPQWCVPDTSDFWSGIQVTWDGKDSIDYTGFQPDFLWEVRRYGPFADSASADTLGQFSRIVNSETGEWKIPLKGYTYTNLETGWYLFYVRNYDDAAVGSVPALGYIDVYEPNWIRHQDVVKDVLFVNCSTFQPVPGNFGSAWADSISEFYANLMEDAGFTTEQWDWTSDTTPPKSMLYNYRMVIVDDIDWNAPIFNVNDNPETVFARYLDVGGKIWVIGRFSFSNVANQDAPVNYPQENHPLAYTYLDLSTTIYPVANFTFAEFVGAEPVSGTGLPRIQVDTLKVQDLVGTYTTAVPKVERLARENNSETIYTFVSAEPGSPGTFHGFPVAIRKDNGVFKSSYFSFHLFFLPYNQASTIFNNMITWYLEE